MSSTLTTSAPRSASSSEQNPPGRRRVRSRTRRSLSGGSFTPWNPEQLACFGDGRNSPADVLRHLPRLGDQVAVRASHLAAREVEVVLEAGADVAAERKR